MNNSLRSHTPFAELPIEARVLFFLYASTAVVRFGTSLKLLKTGWRSLVEKGPNGDLDSDLRVALLALASGERRLAKDFLERSAVRKIESIAMIERPDESDSLPPLAYWYRELRSASAKMMLKGGSAAALTMAEELPRKLAKSNRRTRRPISR